MKRRRAGEFVLGVRQLLDVDVLEFLEPEAIQDEAEAADVDHERAAQPDRFRPRAFEQIQREPADDRRDRHGDVAMPEVLEHAGIADAHERAPDEHGQEHHRDAEVDVGLGRVTEGDVRVLVGAGHPHARVPPDELAVGTDLRLVGEEHARHEHELQRVEHQLAVGVRNDVGHARNGQRGIVDGPEAIDEHVHVAVELALVLRGPLFRRRRDAVEPRTAVLRERFVGEEPLAVVRRAR